MPDDNLHQVAPSSKQLDIRRTPKASGPWCWQHKGARRLIRSKLDGASMTVYALSVYDALTENASDKKSDRFGTYHAHLAMLAGCSIPQLKRALKLLVEFGLVAIQTPKLGGASVYTILALPDAAGADGIVPIELAGSSTRPTGQLHQIDGVAPIEPEVALNGKHGSRATTEECIQKNAFEEQKEQPQEGCGERHYETF